jgi:hypothetical protein
MAETGKSVEEQAQMLYARLGRTSISLARENGMGTVA